MIDLLILTCLIVWIEDLTDFVDTMKVKLWNWTYNHSVPYKPFTIKPFDCSLCLSFWIGLIYIVLAGQFTIPMIGYVGLLSFMTPVICDVLRMMKDIMVKIIDLVYKSLKLEE